MLSHSAVLPGARLLRSFSDPGAARLFIERLQKLGVGRSSPHPRHGGRAAGDGELTLVTDFAKDARFNVDYMEIS